MTQNPMKTNTEAKPVQIALYGGVSGTEIKGYGRVWEQRGKFCWAHPEGAQGAEDTFEQAVQTLESQGFTSDAE